MSNVGGAGVSCRGVVLMSLSPNPFPVISETVLSINPYKAHCRLCSKLLSCKMVIFKYI